RTRWRATAPSAPGAVERAPTGRAAAGSRTTCRRKTPDLKGIRQPATRPQPPHYTRRYYNYTRRCRADSPAVPVLKRTSGPPIRIATVHWWGRALARPWRLAILRNHVGQ